MLPGLCRGAGDKLGVDAEATAHTRRPRPAAHARRRRLLRTLRGGGAPLAQSERAWRRSSRPLAGPGDFRFRPRAVAGPRWLRRPRPCCPGCRAAPPRGSGARWRAMRTARRAQVGRGVGRGAGGSRAAGPGRRAGRDLGRELHPDRPWMSVGTRRVLGPAGSSRPSLRSAHVEGAHLLRGAARRGREHAQRLPQVAARRARAPRVRGLPAPPHPLQGNADRRLPPSGSLLAGSRRGG